jgi:hypothetical protein
MVAVRMVELVDENLKSFIDGHLYRVGEEHFLVYCGASRTSWDVSRTEPGTLAFGTLVVVGAPSRDAAVEALAHAVAD